MRRRKSWISVEIDPVNHAATITGWKAKDLIEQCGGRPYWSRTRSVWCTSESVATDVIALADYEGYGIAFKNLGGAR